MFSKCLQSACASVWSSILDSLRMKDTLPSPVDLIVLRSRPLAIPRFYDPFNCSTLDWPLATIALTFIPSFSRCHRNRLRYLVLLDSRKRIDEDLILLLGFTNSITFSIYGDGNVGPI